MLGRTLLATAIVLPAGCASVPRTPNPIPVAEREYDRVYEAAIAVLRDWRFVVDRQDRRAGVITTKPRIAASALEPWQPDVSTARRTLGATLNHRRHRVRVEIQRRGSGETPYRLRVTVTTEQKQKPEKQLTTAAHASVRYRGRTAGTRPVDAAEGRTRWRVVGEDPVLEKKLVTAIVERATGTRPTVRSTPLEKPAEGSSQP